jgi:hypothetical protein
MIDLIGPDEDLKIAEQVRDYVSEQDHSTDGHDDLFADRGIVETRGPAARDTGSGSAHVPLSMKRIDDDTAKGWRACASRAGNEFGFPYQHTSARSGVQRTETVGDGTESGHIADI